MWRQFASWGAFAIAAVSLGLSLQLWSERRSPTDPLGLQGALDGFDFSTPEAALRSELLLLKPSNRMAHLAHQLGWSGRPEKEIDEEIASFYVDQVHEREGVVFCFTKATISGIPKRDVVTMKRQGDRFVRSFLGSFELRDFDRATLKRGPKDAKAAQILEEWNKWSPDTVGE